MLSSKWLATCEASKVGWCRKGMKGEMWVKKRWQPRAICGSVGDQSSCIGGSSMDDGELKPRLCMLVLKEADDDVIIDRSWASGSRNCASGGPRSARAWARGLNPVRSLVGV